MTLVAVHQPTFLPWLGWWDKLVRADVFVLLDDVQFPNSGRSWMNRVRILLDDEERWLTVRVRREHKGVRTVRETYIDDEKPWRDQALRTIGRAYGRTRFFDQVFPTVEELIRRRERDVAAFNEAGIRTLAARLRLDASKLVRQSDVRGAGTATDRLISLCKAVGGSTYLTGDGSDGYLEPWKFEAAGLRLVYQRFVSPVYPQASGRHVSGLSILDAAMNCGWEGTAGLLRRS